MAWCVVLGILLLCWVFCCCVRYFVKFTVLTSLFIAQTQIMTFENIVACVNCMQFVACTFNESKRVVLASTNPVKASERPVFVQSYSVVKIHILAHKGHVIHCTVLYAYIWTSSRQRVNCTERHTHTHAHTETHTHTDTHTHTYIHTQHTHTHAHAHAHAHAHTHTL